MKIYIKIFLAKLISYIPRNKNIAIFGSWFGDKFADNPKYLFLFANQSNYFKKTIWITKNKHVYRYLRDKNYECYMEKSLVGIYYQIIAKYIFICTGIDDVFSICISGATIINLWHGIPLKKICYDDNLNFIQSNKKAQHLNSFITMNEYSICTSKNFITIYQSAFRKEKSQILNLGQPRNDVFFDDTLELYDENISKIKNSKKTNILYMPTHRNEGKSIFPLAKIIDFEKMDEFCKKHNSTFFIKLHYYHQNEAFNLTRYKNIKDISHYDIDTQLLLKYSNILITDYSSCFIDYLLLSRPIIFYSFDLEMYKRKDRNLYFDYNEITQGTEVTNFNQLVNVLNDTLCSHNSLNKNKLTNFFYDLDNQKCVSLKILEKVKELE